MGVYLKDKGWLKLCTISPKHIFHVLDSITGERIKTERTKQTVYKMLSAMFSKAVMWGYMDKNPCSRVEPPKYKPQEKQVYDRETLSAMFEALQE